MGYERRNIETSQRIRLPASATEEAPALVTTRPEHRRRASGTGDEVVFRAPDRPAYFTVEQGERVLLEGGAHFADPREADFLRAASHNGLRGDARDVRLRNSEEDFLGPLWMLLLGAVLVWGWSLPESRREA